MAEPWATVLELSTGLAKTKGTDATKAHDVVEQMTKGIHHSKWQDFKADTRFLGGESQGTLLYDPSVSRSEYKGPATGPGGVDAVTKQEYDFDYFMTNVIVAGNIRQQCSDNAHTLTVFLHSVGVPVTPRWFSGDDAPNYKTEPSAKYYRAGKAASDEEVGGFWFHEIVIYDSKVYDPSTRLTAAGDPNMGKAFNDYADEMFPGQVAAGIRQRDVTELTIKPPPPLIAGPGMPRLPADNAVVTPQDIAPIVRAATQAWAAAGADVSQLNNVRVYIEDLQGPILGLASGSVITVDRDAAGYGWFIDLSPEEDSEFIVPTLEVSSRVDLLTLVTHELGHVLGLPDLQHEDHSDHHERDDIMTGVITVGVRRIPDHQSLLNSQLATQEEPYSPRALALDDDRGESVVSGRDTVDATSSWLPLVADQRPDQVSSQLTYQLSQTRKPVHSDDANSLLLVPSTNTWPMTASRKPIADTGWTVDTLDFVSSELGDDDAASVIDWQSMDHLAQWFSPLKHKKQIDSDD